jgi:hypothetical protein
MAAKAAQGQHVGLNAGARRGVAGRENEDKRRYGNGFVGCHQAPPAWRMARSLGKVAGILYETDERHLDYQGRTHCFMVVAF